MKKWTVVKPGDAAAAHTGATRDTNAERGVGRGYRQETNMLPVKPATTAVLSGNPTWTQSKSWRSGGNLIGKTGKSTVNVRAANADPGGIGIQTSAWGIAGFGDTAPAAAVASPAPGFPQTLLVAGGLALAAIFLMRR